MQTLKAPLERPARTDDDRLPGKSQVVIEYCVPGNYERVARSLARRIEAEFAIAPCLLPSRGGVFEVTVRGFLVYSKRATRRFPDHDEIFYHVRHRNV